MESLNNKGDHMRKSHRGIAGISKDNYNGLPDNLKEFNYYYQDCGHVIMAIPESILKRAIENGDLDMYECPVPCKYVLEQGYRIVENHVVVDCNYNSFLGLVVDESYYEYDNESSDQDKSEIVKSQVGERFFLNVYREGMFFDTDETGANLIVCFSSPTQKEIAQFDSSVRSEFRLTVKNDILFVLAKIGDLNWMDASYNPSLAPSLKPLDIDIVDGNGIPMWVYLVDARTNILKAQKLIGLGTKFSKDLQRMAKSTMKNGQDNDFNYRLQKIYNRYTTQELVGFSGSYYKTGEKCK